MKRLVCVAIHALIFTMLTTSAIAQSTDSGLHSDVAHFTNPILQGGFPDPSICRVGDDFYMVNSTFEYFPGLPIHHSKDLVNWELIGYGLHRKEQATGAVNLIDVNSDGGIHAPTIRCHKGKFYIITTNVFYHEDTNTTDFVNFVITADDPRGPWSMPHVIEGAPGIDPDIFFDDDGKVWYAGTQSPANPNFDGEGEIWLQELDTENWKLVGERHFLWRGACGGVWVEGPHIYKKDGMYYLLVAEGGTSVNHAVMVAASKNITGPYVSNPRNPILTSRHLSYSNWVQSTGHGDLVELADGRWYMVLLGIRGDEGLKSNMGRESHLVPVTWEREPQWWKEEKLLWPVVAPQTGRVERKTPVPFKGTQQQRNLTFTDNFDGNELKLQWNFRRVPQTTFYSLTQKKGYLRVNAQPAVLKERGQASLIGFRQTESNFVYTAKMTFSPSANKSEAGIIIYQKDNNFIKLTKQKKGNKSVLSAVYSSVTDNSSIVDKVTEIGSAELPDDNHTVFLRIEANSEGYRLSYSTQKAGDYTVLASAPSNAVVSRKYTGANLGVYVTGNGEDSSDYADFDWVEYQAFER